MALPPILPAPKAKSKPLPLPPILPPPPRAAPMPRTNLATGANPRGVAIAGQVRVPYAPPPRQTVNDVAARTLTTGANPRGVAIIQRTPPKAYLKTAGYQQAVLNVFEHQSAQQQKAIVQGALRHPTDESKIILNYIKRIGAGPSGASRLAAITPGVSTKLVGAAIDATAGVPKGVLKVVQNAAKDAWDLPGGTVEGLYAFGKQAVPLTADVLTGNVKGAASHGINVAHMLADPYIQLAEHPIRTVLAHPLNTALMIGGAESALGKGASMVADTGALGGAAKAAASTARADLHIGTIAGEPAPIVEARSYSPDLLRKGVQVAREKALRAKGQDPNIARPAPRILSPGVAHALNIGQEAKLNRIVDEMSSVRQVSGRAARARALSDLKRATKDVPKETKPVVGHILQGVIRSPETAFEHLDETGLVAPGDIQKEIDRLKAAQTGKRTIQQEWNKKQVRDLIKAKAAGPEAMAKAFAAAKKLRPTIKSQDAYLIQKALLNSDQATRRAVLSYAMAHMGAIPDEAFWRGLTPGSELTDEQAAYSGVRKANGNPLTTQEIYDHIAGFRDVDMPNPDHAEAQSARNDAAIAHHESLAAHHTTTGAHRAATAELEAARGEFQAHTTGGPTPAEQRLIDLITALRNRPGTPGEGAAAQARLDSILTRVAARGGTGISRDRLAAAEAQLEQAIKDRSVTRRAVGHTGAELREAERNLRKTPATVKTQVLTGPQVPDPAYVGHFPGKTKPSMFYQAYQLARGDTAGRHAFTGRAFQQGAYDHTLEGLAGQLGSRAEAVTKATLHDKVVNRLGIKMPQQMRNRLVRQVFADARAGKRSIESARSEAALIRAGYFTRQEAEKFQQAAKVEDFHNPVPNALELTPISAAPAHVLDEVKDLQHPSELNNVSGVELRALTRAMEDAKHSTTRNITLVPKVATDRFAAQYAKADATMRGIGKVTQQFRRTVLPYSTHWMAQIGTEAGVRALLAGVLDPRYLRTGRALMKRLAESPEGRDVAAETTGATFFNNRDVHAIHNPHPGNLSAMAHSFPPTKALLAAHNHYANLIGHGMYALEHQFRVMGLGKIAHREMREFTRSWQKGVRTQGLALDELSTRLKNNPALVAKLGREIDDIFGKYNKFSPKVRSAIQSYAPFLPWYLNAAKYVLWTLPAHHPVASALLASLRQTMNQDVADGKQLPLNAYAMQELARVTPFGIFTPPSAKPSAGALLGGQHVLDAILPQVTGAYSNLSGVNSFGQGPLKGPAGDVKAQSGPARAAAVESLLEGIIPVLRYAREIREKGKPAYGTSTIVSPQTKPDEGTPTVGSAADRILNPFYSFEDDKRSTTAPPYAGPDTRAPLTSRGSSWGGSGASTAGGWG